MNLDFFIQFDSICPLVEIFNLFTFKAVIDMDRFVSDTLLFLLQMSCEFLFLFLSFIDFFCVIQIFLVYCFKFSGSLTMVLRYS